MRSKIDIPVDLKRPVSGSGVAETRQFLLSISPVALRIIANRMEERRKVVLIGQSATAAVWYSEDDHTEIHFSDNQED